MVDVYKDDKIAPFLLFLISILGAIFQLITTKRLKENTIITKKIPGVW